MTDLTEQELIALAERISRLGRNTGLHDFMGALGLVLYSCFQQVPHEDRLQNVAAWLGALLGQITREEHKRKAN